MSSAEVIHRLGMGLSLTCFAGGAVLLISAALRRRSAHRRCAALWPGGGHGTQWLLGDLVAHWVARSRLSKVRTGIKRTHLVAIGCGCLGPVLFTGWIGYGLGLALAYGGWWWQRTASVKHGRKATQAGPGAADGALTAEEESLAAAQLPLAADLLAACLAAGAGPGEAADAVGDSLAGPVGQRLAAAAAELRLGGEPSTAWRRVSTLPHAAGLARPLERATVTGAPAVDALTRWAAECRADRGRAATARARRAGAVATAPLGLCFLPAFLLMGVAPVVIGLADGLLAT